MRSIGIWWISKGAPGLFKGFQGVPGVFQYMGYKGIPGVFWRVSRTFRGFCGRSIKIWWVSEAFQVFFQRFQGCFIGVLVHGIPGSFQSVSEGIRNVSRVSEA